jgi:hypothetical protein
MMEIEKLRQQLMDLEERLLVPGIRHSQDSLGELLDPDFIEFGSTGKIYDKTGIIEALLTQCPVSISLSDFQVALLAPGIALATYKAVYILNDNISKYSLRSSIWKKSDNIWRLLFHQGTPANAELS